MYDDMLLTPKQKIIKSYLSLSNFVCIYILSTLLFSNIITRIFIFLSSKNEILDIANLNVMQSTHSASKVEALFYIAFAISCIISIFVSRKLTYIFKFNKVRFKGIKKIITGTFCIAFTVILSIFIGGFIYYKELEIILKPIITFEINFYNNFLPSLFMFNDILGIG